MTAISNSTVVRALTYTPHGRDAAVVEALLREIGITSLACPDLKSFEAGLDDEVCFAIITEEAMASADLRIIAAKLDAQPAWSDLPFIILTHRGGGPERNSAAARLSEVFSNVTFVERPFYPTTFISVVRTANKGRQRQYDARTRIEELHESEERLRTALSAGRLGSWELELAGLSLTVSTTCKAVFGRGPDDPFTYEELQHSIHADDWPGMQAAVQTAVETGDDYAGEYRNIWPDGTQHWADLRASLVADRRTGTLRLAGVSSDITDRKTAEDRLRQMNETLEQRVNERTDELRHAHEIVLAEIEQREHAEEKLRQAQKMEMVGQLTGGVAHDFNNLLMAVLGNLDLLRKHVPAEPRIIRFIDGALQGAQRGAALTQRLLAFARRQDLKVEPTNLADLVRGMTDLIERSVGAQIDLRVALPATLPLALVDANQIEMALLNLAVNARDAMPKGGQLSIAADCVELTASSDLASGKYVRLSVADTGEGMSPETLKRATEPFFSTKELGKGTGLGLSMIQGLAQQLNGGLRLTSEIGRGTTAELLLPVTMLAATPDEEAPQHADHEMAPQITILVVDDDALIATSTVDMLEDLGHRVIGASSGDSALKILGKDTVIDLLITDYSMPRMNGAQLAKAAREVRPDLPILLATGYADLPAGATIDLPRIGKPYQQYQLAAEISKVLLAGTAEKATICPA